MTRAGEPSTDPRRRVPRTDVLLSHPQLEAAAKRVGRAAVKAALSRAQQLVREGQLAPDQVAEHALGSLPESASSLRAVINATGVIVHTNLGRAPLSPAAMTAVATAAGSTDVELDLETGRRGRRGRGALDALAEAVPLAEAVGVVNNNAAALLLCALALAAGREIIISRGELVEIGDGFRIPELLASAGARVREVGATNRVARADYLDALGPDTAFVLKVHPSNFVVSGFTRSVPADQLAGLGVPLVVDIGSGLLQPHPLLPDEPDAAGALRGGADLVTASADKLLGGPQAGLLLGRADLVERLRRHPAARAMRVDKLTLAGLEASLRGGPTPVQLALAAPVDSLLARAERLAQSLSATGIDARAVPSRAGVGGGGAPGVNLPSAAVSLPENFAAALRAGRPPVVGHVEAGRCLLDLRAVPAEVDSVLADAVRAAHERVNGGSKVQEPGPQ